MSRNSRCKPDTPLSAGKFEITDTKLQIKSDLESDIFEGVCERANLTRSHLKNRVKIAKLSDGNIQFLPVPI